jgi:hypothetical protein
MASCTEDRLRAKVLSPRTSTSAAATPVSAATLAFYIVADRLAQRRARLETVRSQRLAATGLRVRCRSTFD